MSFYFVLHRIYSLKYPGPYCNDGVDVEYFSANLEDARKYFDELRPMSSNDHWKSRHKYLVKAPPGKIDEGLINEELIAEEDLDKGEEKDGDKREEDRKFLEKYYKMYHLQYRTAMEELEREWDMTHSNEKLIDAFSKYLMDRVNNY